MLMVKGSPQTPSVGQHARSAQSCGFRTFSDEVDGQAEGDDRDRQMCCSSRPLSLLRITLPPAINRSTGALTCSTFCGQSSLMTTSSCFWKFG